MSEFEETFGIVPTPLHIGEIWCNPHGDRFEVTEVLGDHRYAIRGETGKREILTATSAEALRDQDRWYLAEFQ